MCSAAKAIGNSELEARFTEGIISNILKRKTEFRFFSRNTKDQT